MWSDKRVVLLAVVYIGVVIAANVTATWFVGSLSVGTFVFGAMFTLRDRLHEHGRRVVYCSIAVAAILSAGVVVAGGAEWRVVLASLVGLVLGEAADTELFHRTAGTWMRRVATSNAVSIPLDTLLFNIIAFAGVLPGLFVVSLSMTDIAVKSVLSAFVAVCLRR